MRGSAKAMKATPQEYDYHQRLCARGSRGDPTAFAELAEKLYASLVQDVRKRAGHAADPILVEEAVGQALLDYHDRPESYDPDRKSLQSYLVMAAYRDFQNARARENRLQERQISLFDPAFSEHDIVESQEQGDDIDTIINEIDAEALWARIDALFPDPTERGVVELIISRVRVPEPYIQLLHLNDLPTDEQHRQVKLVKYRITRRLRRNLMRLLPRAGGET